MRLRRKLLALGLGALALAGFGASSASANTIQFTLTAYSTQTVGPNQYEGNFTYQVDLLSSSYASTPTLNPPSNPASYAVLYDFEGFVANSAMWHPASTSVGTWLLTTPTNASGIVGGSHSSSTTDFVLTYEGPTAVLQGPLTLGTVTAKSIYANYMGSVEVQSYDLKYKDLTHEYVAQGSISSADAPSPNAPPLVPVPAAFGVGLALLGVVAVQRLRRRSMAD